MWDHLAYAVCLVSRRLIDNWSTIWVQHATEVGVRGADGLAREMLGTAVIRGGCASRSQSTPPAPKGGSVTTLARTGRVAAMVERERSARARD